MPAESDRRTHTRLREVFAEAIALIEPLFRQDNSWTNVSLEYCAQRVLRDRYPELEMMDIYVFVMAAKRVYADPSDTTAPPLHLTAVHHPASRRRQRYQH